jgi:hypothetical protein
VQKFKGFDRFREASRMNGLYFADFRQTGIAPNPSKTTPRSRICWKTNARSHKGDWSFTCQVQWRSSTFHTSSCVRQHPCAKFPQREQSAVKP